MLKHVELFASKILLKVLSQHGQVMHHKLKTSRCKACIVTHQS